MTSQSIKIISTTLIALLIAIMPTALAEPPVYTDVPTRLRVEFCDHSSEIPHFSEHVPGTINVSGRTICKGTSKNWKVSVRVTVIRHDGGNTPRITKSSSGNGKAIVNISMTCNRTRKQAKVLYTITTVHKVPTGQTYYTENEASLAC